MSDDAYNCNILRQLISFIRSLSVEHSSPNRSNSRDITPDTDPLTEGEESYDDDAII